MFLPVLLIGGIIVGPSSYLVAAAGTFYFISRGRHDTVILMFVTILILGDSRIPSLQFIKNIRIEMLVIIAGWTIYEIRRGRYEISRYFIYYLPFLFVAVLALAFNPKLDLAINKTISFSLLYFVGLHYIRFRFEHYSLELIKDIVFTCHLVLLLGLLLFPIVPVIVSYGGTRFNGLLGNPNGLGIFITLITPLTLILFKYNPSIPRSYRTFAWFLIVISLVLCSSRNAIFSFTLFILLYQGLGGSTFRRLIFLMVFIPVAGLLIYNIELEALVINLGLEKYFRIKDFESGSGRIFAWQHAWELVKQNPLIGCGFACEEYNFIFKTTYRLWRTGHQGGVHNSYLAFLVNTGYIGFGLFVFFLTTIFRRITDTHFVFPYLAAVTFSAMFESWLFSSLSAFHIFFVVTIVFMMVYSTQPQLQEFGEGLPDDRMLPQMRPAT
ncbi:MAG: O-antigen ligase family protein [Bacteroidota bacterium]